MGLAEKNQSTLDLHRKKIFSALSIVLLWRMGLRIYRSRDPLRKIYIFFSVYCAEYYYGVAIGEKFQSALPKKKIFLDTVLVLHRICNIFFGIYSTATNFFYNYSTIMVHGTWKLLFGIMLLLHEKHVDTL